MIFMRKLVVFLLLFSLFGLPAQALFDSHIWQTIIEDANVDDINGFLQCSGSQWLGADGLCHSFGGIGGSTYTGINPIFVDNDANTIELKQPDFNAQYCSWKDANANYVPYVGANNNVNLGDKNISFQKSVSKHYFFTNSDFFSIVTAAHPIGSADAILARTRGLMISDSGTTTYDFLISGYGTDNGNYFLSNSDNLIIQTTNGSGKTTKLTSAQGTTGTTGGTGAILYLYGGQGGEGTSANGGTGAITYLGAGKGGYGYADGGAGGILYIDGGLGGEPDNGSKGTKGDIKIQTIPSSAGNYGKIILGVDNVKTYFGTENDASITYNGTNIIINPKEVGTGKLIIDGNLVVAPYDINANKVYYKTLVSYSPALFCDAHSEKCFGIDFDSSTYTFCDKNTAICSTRNEKIEKKIKTINCEEKGNGYSFDGTKCNFNPITECESRGKQYFWTGTECKKNPYWTCIIEEAKTKDWDYETMSCVINQERACVSEMNDWNSASKTCTINLKNQCEKNPLKKWDNRTSSCINNQKEICLLDRTKIWNGTSCVNATSISTSD